MHLENQDKRNASKKLLLEMEEERMSHDQTKELLLKNDNETKDQLPKAVCYGMSLKKRTSNPIRQEK